MKGLWPDEGAKMRFKGTTVLLPVAVAAVLSAASCGPPAQAQARAAGTVRVMTYNVEWFSEDANPKRVANLRSVLGHIGPDIVAFEEVQSSRALRQIVDGDWDIGMVDDDGDQQETAIAVRRPFLLVSAEPVFKGHLFEKPFPRSRDGLRGVVQTPEGRQLVLYVVHMKSRRGGRLETDPDREAACGLLAAYVRSRPDERNVVVLGDFNDCPDDASVEVLETGDLFARGGSARGHGRLLENLTAPLADKDYVSFGLFDLFRGGDVSPIVPGAKQDNDRLRGQEYEYPRDVKVRQSLFDQILVSNSLAQGARAAVYSGQDALRGEPGKTKVSGHSVTYTFKGDLASDHVPVYVDLVVRDSAGP